MAGLTIYSTQDSKIQTTTETEFEKKKYSLSSKNGTDSSQAAMVIIDHKTGYVVATVGGIGEDLKRGGLNAVDFGAIRLLAIDEAETLTRAVELEETIRRRIVNADAVALPAGNAVLGHGIVGSKLDD